MKNLILIKFIILSFFFISVGAEQKSNPYQTNIKSGNPFLSEKKELKEIRFQDLRDILVKNNQEYAAAIERLNQASYDLKATLN